MSAVFISGQRSAFHSIVEDASLTKRPLLTPTKGDGKNGFQFVLRYAFRARNAYNLQIGAIFPDISGVNVTKVPLFLRPRCL